MTDVDELERLANESARNYAPPTEQFGAQFSQARTINTSWIYGGRPLVGLAAADLLALIAELRALREVAIAAEDAMNDLKKHFQCYEYEKAHYVVNPEASMWIELNKAIATTKK